jgi:glycine reductase
MDAMELSGKKVIAIGERDGVQGTSIGNCARSAGATVVLEMTHCFV